MVMGTHDTKKTAAVFAPVRARFQALAQRSQAASLALLQLFLRFVPSERRRVFALTLLIGVLCGLAAVAFHLTILFLERHLIDQALVTPAPYWIILTLLLPTLGGLVSGALLYYVVPDARGSGIPQVKVAYAVKGGRMPFRVAAGKFLIGAIQIGSGASLGREGPTVQICAGIASLLGRLVALPRQRQGQLLPVGAAAGIAAAFNAPIAAVTFTIEEVVGDLDQTVLTGVIVAAAIAAAIERVVLGEHPVFTIPSGYGLHHAESLLLYAVLGVAGALVSMLFTDSLLRLRTYFQQHALLPAWARPGVGGLVTGVLAVVALLWLKTTGVTGGGYETLGRALEGQLAVKVLLALCLMKLVATVFCYSSGGAGGIFAPALFIGGMLGGAIGFLDVALFQHDSSEIGAFALVGMGTVFAGIIRAPITSVLIIFEMTGGYGLILPLMIANMTAFGIARHFRPAPIYEALLEQDGVRLPHPRRPQHALEHIQIGEAMTTHLTTLPAEMPVATAAQQVRTYPYSSFPVLTSNHELVGLISEARLRRSLAEGAGEQPIASLADRRTALFPDQPLLDAVILMDQQETRQIGVVARADSARLVGLLALSDIVRAQARVARSSAQGKHAETFDLSEVGETLSDQPAFRRLRPFVAESHAAAAPGDAEPRYHTLVLAPESPAVGRAVCDLELPHGALLVTLERDGQTLVPRGDTVLLVGDRVTLFAPPLQLPGAVAILTGASTEDTG
jgi:CIC family chloride channel protein